MKKILLLICSIIIIVSGCSVKTDENKYVKNAISETKLENLIDAINNRDVNSVKLLFSQQALQDAKNLDENIEYMFDIVDGDIVSHSYIVRVTTTTVKDGKRIQKERAWSDVVTNTQKTYRVLFAVYLQDDYNSNREGLYAIQVLPEEMKEYMLNSDEIPWNAGVYY